MITIYKITNRLNHKLYVGQTKQSIERRLLQQNTPLGNAIRDCGLENFTIEFIEECETKAQANQQERFWIRVLNCKVPNSYNQSNGGEGGIHKPRDYTFGSAMKLGEIIREYRLHNHMSMGDFARMSGISKLYVSMLETNKNSNGGKPIAPSVETLQKAAYTIGISLDDLLRKLGDEKIDLRPAYFNEDEVNPVNGYRLLSDDGKQLVNSMVSQLSNLPSSRAKTRRSVIQKNSGGTNFIAPGDTNYKAVAP